MNFFASIAETWKAVRAKSVSSSLAAWARGEDLNESRGATMVSAYQQSVWVYAAINALAQQVAQIPFRFSTGERGGENILRSGAIVDLYNRPHPQINRFAYWELRVTWLMLRGECYVVPISEGRGVTQLIVLGPDNFQKVIENNELIGFVYSGSTNSPIESRVFLPEEIYFDKLPNPYSFWDGFSPLTVARLAAETDFAAANFQKGLMLNNADTGVIVTTDQQVDEPQREAILAALKERKRKAGTADRPLFLWGGAKVEKPSLSSTDMQYLENRKYNRQEICAVFGVPQEILGFTEDANRSVGESSRLNFIENRVAPLCERLEACEEPLVKSFGKNLFGFFDIDALPIMAAARRARVDTGVKVFSMGVPFNEINEVYNLGFKPLAWGNKGYLPFSLTEAGTSNSEDAKPQSEKPVEDEEKSANPFTKMVGLLDKVNFEQIKNNLGPQKLFTHQCAANPEYEAALAGAVKNKRGKLSKFFFEQRGRVLANLEKELNNEDTKSQREKLLTLCLSGLVVQKSADDIFDSAAENEKLLARMNPLLKVDLEFGGAQMFAELQLADEFKIPPAKAIEFLSKRKQEIEGINATTFDQLKSSLAEGLQAGETFEKLVDRVKEVYQDATDRRAETIATTETNIAVNAGRFEAMKEAKVERKGWQTSNLENTRAAHIQAEKDYSNGIPIDEPFVVGGEELDHPGDPKGSPGNVINCRCFTFAVLNSEDAKTQRKFLSYEQWLTNTEKTKA